MSCFSLSIFFFFFFNDTATTEIYTLSLHDALPICARTRSCTSGRSASSSSTCCGSSAIRRRQRSEEHTSELQSRLHLVCRLLLEKKKKKRDKRNKNKRDMRKIYCIMRGS